MICEHPETGIRIVVNKRDLVESVVNARGEERTVKVGEEWLTEAGQEARPTDHLDYPRLPEVLICGSNGTLHIFLVVSH